MTKQVFLLFFTALAFISCAEKEPAPVGPIPSKRQLAWQPLEYYAFVHFNMNTFTDMEWGLGGESPKTFNPTHLDTRQWAKTVKKAGMKGIILTAKHHDGFCLWPTKTTEHSIKNSPYKNGKGDIVKELAEACKENGLKFGVYLSPWDRNNKNYGKPEYVAIFHQQLRELLTNYGDIFEVWFDGANGGTGYYGGANEERKIDNKTYYQWEKAIAIVRELQPKAVIFSDGGPDIRWVGNEEGWANETNWSIMRRDEIYPGWPRYKELRSGHEDGTHWLPAEADVSIRPGWYYHASEDHQVKTLAQLVDIYYKSVGRNASFLLNIPVDKRGLVHEKDSIQLMKLRRQLDKDFAQNVVSEAKTEASNSRSKNYRAHMAIDGNQNTYWATEDSVTSASVTLSFHKPQMVNRVLLQEYIPLGQRVKKFKIEAKVDGKWKLIDEQTTIGYKRILRFDRIEASKVKIAIEASKGPILLSNIALYNAPNLLVQPIIKRNKNGMVSLQVPDDAIEIYYSVDGTEPTLNSPKYSRPFMVNEPKILKVIAYNPETEDQTGVLTKKLETAKKNWKVLEASSGKQTAVAKVIDANPETYWATDASDTAREISIDFGENIVIKGFSYTPMQARFPFGIITDYEFSVSTNGKNWKKISQGEFGNIVNNRIKQEVNFTPVEAQYIKLKAIKVAGDDVRATYAEIGILKD
ncbi:alpha-L-fucosidase [Galbibacter sp. PAP.153]|uniref:alpha-L-fucosidase n=1 Tax=Galbibacter sp. PAP.153 TaxID=3104623 RepID=UPI00300A8F44